MPALAALLVLASPAPRAHAQTGSVTGTVTVEPGQRGGARGGPGSYRGPGARSTGSREPGEAPSVVVWVEAEGGGAAAPSGPNPVLNQRGTAFEPGLLPIRVGQTVLVRNSDPLYHNVFSLSATKRFNIGRRRTGESVPVRFDRPGVVEVFCDIHSHMNATILVLPEQAVAVDRIEAGGRFELRGLRPGRYQLHVFAAGDVRQTRSVDVAAGRSTDTGPLHLSAR